ncbi:MAG: type II toxin-antitoxin system VapC family toxin [Actinomycetota bacterium]
MTPGVTSALRTSENQPGPLLVDTSVAVALVVADHTAHETTIEALGGRRLGLAGHAAFETFSVLTRLPSPARRTPAAAARLISVNFPNTKFISPQAASGLVERLSHLGIAGGSVYDALVAGAAEEHKITLATRDRRALETYRKFRVDLEILG